MHRLRITVAADMQRFCDFLRAAQVAVHESEGTVVNASLPGAPSELHERRELTGYVTTWNALNPGSTVELED